MEPCEDSAGSPRSRSAGCFFMLQGTKPFTHLFVSLARLPPHSLSPSLPPSLRCLPCLQKGSFPFLTGCCSFWRWPGRMRAPTAVSHPTLPEKTWVTKPGSLSPQVRAVALLYCVWMGSQDPVGSCRTSLKKYNASLRARCLAKYHVSEIQAADYNNNNMLQ